MKRVKREDQIKRALEIRKACNCRIKMVTFEEFNHIVFINILSVIMIEKIKVRKIYTLILRHWF